MNEIRVTVNIVVFVIFVLVWLSILVLKLLGHEIPDDINTLFAMIGGGLIVLFQAFKEGVTFTSKTETSIETIKKFSTTDPPKGVTDEKVSDPIAPAV